MKKRNISKFCISLLLLCVMIINFTACTARVEKRVEASNMLYSVAANKVNLKPVDDAFISSSADFAIKIFQKSITKDKNSLISPLSVMLALAMTANGANGQTKSEMEALLGGNITLDVLNEYLYTYVLNLPSSDKYKLKIANSIWFHDDKNQFIVEKDFLQKNADYYNAASYKSPFNEETIKDINNWVNNNTDGMIDEIINEIDNDTLMYLVNAIVFEAEWDTVYKKKDIKNDIFTAIDGSKRKVKMMMSDEYKYIETENAVGFVKDYKEMQYSFVALLPNIGVDINEYIKSLTGESFMNAITNISEVKVEADLPKFKYEYNINMNNFLSSLRMPTAFNKDLADFSKLGTSNKGNIFIGDIIHKTYIAVDELGTKAGAVTEMQGFGAAAPSEPKYVKLDRPFIYAIVDNATGLPVFIGTVMDIQK